jgi:hypothetical protein
MLRKIHICALQADAGKRPRWITPCKRSAARGMDDPPVLVETGPALSLPRAAPAACTGLSISDTFRRQPVVHKKYCATSNNQIIKYKFNYEKDFYNDSNANSCMLPVCPGR